MAQLQINAASGHKVSRSTDHCKSVPHPNMKMKPEQTNTCQWSWNLNSAAYWITKGGIPVIYLQCMFLEKKTTSKYISVEQLIRIKRTACRIQWHLAVKLQVATNWIPGPSPFPSKHVGQTRVAAENAKVNEYINKLERKKKALSKDSDWLFRLDCCSNVADSTEDLLLTTTTSPTSKLPGEGKEKQKHLYKQLALRHFSLWHTSRSSWSRETCHFTHPHFTSFHRSIFDLWPTTTANEERKGYDSWSTWMCTRYYSKILRWVKTRSTLLFHWTLTQSTSR